jgi:hypothetical protein
MLGFLKAKPSVVNSERVFNNAIDAAIENAREGKIPDALIARFLSQKAASIQAKMDAIIERRQAPGGNVHHVG